MVRRRIAGIALMLMLWVDVCGAGQNAGAIARFYWQVGTGPGMPERNSTAATAQLVVTVRGVTHFRGAELQLTIRGCNGPLPPAWQMQDGGCASPVAEFRPGGYGGALYPSLLTSGGSVPALATSQLGMYYQYADNPCIAPDSTGTVWVSLAGAAGAPRDGQQEYGLFALRLDLSGVSTGGCRGDLGSPGGPEGVTIRPHYFLPCNGRPDMGSVLALVDDDAAIDYIPFEQGYDNLTWFGIQCPDSGLGVPAPPAALIVSSVTPEEPTADTNTGFTVLGSGFQAPLQVVFSGPNGRVTAETARVLNPNAAYVELIVPRWLAGSVDVIVRSAQDSAVLPGAIHYTKFRGVPDSLIAILHAKAADAALADFNTTALPKLRQLFPGRTLIALSRAELGEPSRVERTPDGWYVSYGSPNSGPFITVHFDIQFAIRRVYSRWSSA